MGRRVRGTPDRSRVLGPHKAKPRFAVLAVLALLRAAPGSSPGSRLRREPCGALRARLGEGVPDGSEAGAGRYPQDVGVRYVAHLLGRLARGARRRYRRRAHRPQGPGPGAAASPGCSVGPVEHRRGLRLTRWQPPGPLRQRPRLGPRDLGVSRGCRRDELHRRPRARRHAKARPRHRDAREAHPVDPSPAGRREAPGRGLRITPRAASDRLRGGVGAADTPARAEKPRPGEPHDQALGDERHAGDLLGLHHADERRDGGRVGRLAEE